MARKRFFISYRRADEAGPEIARQLHDRLGLQYGGKNVFLDKKDIERGRRWLRVIEDEIAASDVVVVLIGPRWLDLLKERDEADDVLSHEIGTALASGKQVIPVLILGAAMPTVEELPVALRPLAEIQALEMSLESFDRDLRRLVGRVKPGWALGLGWAVANLVGGFLGLSFSSLAAIAVTGALGEERSGVEIAVWLAGIAASGAIFGVSVGVAQWLVIRHWIGHARRLIYFYGALDGLGLVCIASLLRFGEEAIWSQASAGILIVLCITLGGVGLWLVLRRQLQGAGWWSALNVGAPLACLYLASVADSGWDWALQTDSPATSWLFFPGWFLGFLIPGLLLVFQMRRSQLEPV